MSHKSLLVGFILFAALESCHPKQKKQEVPSQPTPAENVVIKEQVVYLNNVQEEQLKIIGKSNAFDRCKSIARLDSPMNPHDFASEYTLNNSDKQKRQFRIKPENEGDCLTGANTLVFNLKTEVHTEGTPDLTVNLSTSLDFAPVDAGGAPAVGFITNCTSVLYDDLIAARQKTEKLLNEVTKRKALKTVVEEICPQIQQEVANYAIGLLSR